MVGFFGCLFLRIFFSILWQTEILYIHFEDLENMSCSINYYFKEIFVSFLKCFCLYSQRHLLNWETLLKAPAPAINNVAIIYEKWEVFSRLDWKSLIKEYFTGCGRSCWVGMSQEDVGIEMG